MSDYNCIDVSEWNGDIEWEAAKASGVEYALIRCGFGQDMESQDDKYFHINMENALAAGVKVGVYFYSYAENYEKAVGEAVHCLRLVEPYKHKISLPVFYDLEEDKIKDNAYSVYTAFEDYLNSNGYNVGCYASQSWIDTYLKALCPKYNWVAKWGGRKPDWECDIWQYSSQGSVPGVGSGVDLDIVYNDDMKPLIDDPQNDVDITIKVKAPEGVKVNINVEKE